MYLEPTPALVLKETLISNVSPYQSMGMIQFEYQRCCGVLHLIRYSVSEGPSNSLEGNKHHYIRIVCYI